MCVEAGAEAGGGRGRLEQVGYSEDTRASLGFRDDLGIDRVFGVAASTREIDLQNLTRVPRFGKSIDRQESENQTEVLAFEFKGER